MFRKTPLKYEEARVGMLLVPTQASGWNDRKGMNTVRIKSIDPEKYIRVVDVGVNAYFGESGYQSIPGNFYPEVKKITIVISDDDEQI